MMNKLTNWTTTEYGQVIVGASVLTLGLSTFGYGMGLEEMLGGKVGLAMGAVGILIGASTLIPAVKKMI